ILIEEEIPARAERTGKYILGELKRIQGLFPEWIRDVRGKGLLIGVEVTHPDLALLVTSFLTGRGVVVAYTLNNPNVIRIEPPLVISDELVSRVITAFEESMAQAVEAVKSLDLAE
nr:aminotransferase class III-fold pyridoxal phosphate-dependent enzyme [Armatimonadota bacterium]